MKPKTKAKLRICSRVAYGDVVTDEMSTASRKVAELVFASNGAQAERKAS
jgi:hypothetical protein